MAKKVIALDIGATKIAAGIVNSSGKILTENKFQVDTSGGPETLISQVQDIIQKLKTSEPNIEAIGIASAGPLDPAAGVLLDPTNFFTDGQSWGQVQLLAPLKAKFKVPILLENDAAAAALGEHWIGESKDYGNAIQLSLGTGLGVGIIANGHLVRSGRNLHTEAGHMIINFDDKTALGPDGNHGTAEAYLSGFHFSQRFSSLWGEKLTGEKFIEKAQSGDPKALDAFDDYARMMAYTLNNYIVIFSPEIVVFSGGFSQAVPFFLEKTKAVLADCLKRRREGIDLFPHFATSQMNELVGLVGAAYVAFNS